VIDVGYDAEEIQAAVRRHLTNGRSAASTLYGDGQAGRRIADILATVPLRVEKRLTY
jgi:hypothetical protein